MTDTLLGIGLLTGLVFAPWAYGTTEPWSIALLNANGWCLGGVWIARKLRDAHLGLSPARPGPVRVLGGLTIAILLYEFASALNARAAFDAATGTFATATHLTWLPGSMDAVSTWRTLQRDVALAGTFWASVAWLTGGRNRTPQEPAKVEESGAPAIGQPPERLSWRIGLLISVLTINAIALGAEGLWQRHTGSDRLLFRIRPTINKHVEQQFGPYAYRGNAVQYFSMVWPLGVGFWSAAERLRGSRGRLRGRLLLASAIIVGTLPLLTRSRTGVMVGTGGLLAAALLLVLLHWNQGRRQRWRVGGVLLLALAIGWLAGWSRISYRLKKGGYFADAGRAELRVVGWQMFTENPVFGTGPGTFEAVYPLHRPEASAILFSQMHCDWLETLSTFGLVGAGLIATALAALAGTGKTSGAWAPGRDLFLMSWLGLGSCLLYAGVDFPFQVYSLLHLFVVVCALVCSLSVVSARHLAPLPEAP